MTERGRYRKRWLGKWERSGLTQAEFCRRHGLKHALSYEGAVNFGWWNRNLREPVGPLRPRPRRRPGFHRPMN